MSKKLTAKIIIRGRIQAVTGLHIGGSKSSLDIGGVDLNIIKTPHGVPFIPGSSLKGKLRSMLARVVGSMATTSRDAKGELSDEQFPYILELFGSSGDAEGEKACTTRLLVRDAFLDQEHFNEQFNGQELDLEFSTIKWENRINRRTGTAEHPRQLERVPAGAEFPFELIYDVYADAEESYENSSITRLAKHQQALDTALSLMEHDYLGGQGSRGYGKIKFIGMTIKKRVINQETGIFQPEQDAEDFWQTIAQKFQ